MCCMYGRTEQLYQYTGTADGVTAGKEESRSC